MPTRKSKIPKSKQKTPSEPQIKRPRGNPNFKKGMEMPAWLKEHSFAVRPDHINKYGVPTDFITMRKMIQKMGNEAVLVGKVDGKDIILTRAERILFDWFTSQDFQKQKAIIEYMVGKVPDKIDVSGELKVIKVTLKRKTDDAGT